MYRCKTIIKILLISFIFTGLMAFSDDNSKENFLILKALQERNDDPKRAITTFENLYELTKNSIYLKEAVKIAYVFGDDRIHRLIRKEDKNILQDNEYLRIKIEYFLNSNRKDEALKMAKELVEKEPISKNYSLLGVIQNSLDLDDEASKSYNKAYKLDANEDTLIDLAYFYVTNFNDIENAKKELETYRKLKGCTVRVCSFLIDIYKAEGSFSKIADIYEDLYNQTKREAFLDDMVDLYLNNKDFDNAIKVLKKHNNNPKLLVEIYAYLEKFDLAIASANEAYKDSGDVEFLAMKGVYAYEKYGSKISQKDLNEVIDDFDKSVPNLDIALYQNYYGYLLIDLDIDVKKGISLVEKALEKEPDSPYYLDSLSWGYYKLNECEKADELMQKINSEETEFFDSDEGKEHLRAIKECLESKNDIR